jgi:GT2 family glycosyltransferase
MKISYAITVCNEFVEIQRLINFLLKNKRKQDEIVILYDEGNGDPSIEEFLRAKSINGEFNWHKDKFNHHFADWKNKLNRLCSGDYIFQIDADEVPNETLINALPAILENNDFDICLVPRVNTVEGLTEAHIQKWGWSVNEHGWVNWPDKQWRLYRNSKEIKWENKVHERLVGFKTYTTLPEVLEMSLFHHKTIDRQERQNEFYERI